MSSSDPGPGSPTPSSSLALVLPLVLPGVSFFSMFALFLVWPIMRMVTHRRG